jgi:hypothetical protein
MRPQNLTRGRTGIPKMKLQGSGLFHPKTLQSQNCQSAENRLSLNGLEFVHGQLAIERRDLTIDPLPVNFSGKLHQLVFEIDDLIKPRAE